MHTSPTQTQDGPAMRPFTDGLARRYGTALAAVALAVLLAVIGQQIVRGQGDLLLLCLAAVTVSAWYGGVGPGLFATMLAIVATDYLMPVLRTGTPQGLTDRLRPSLFASVAILISALSQAKKHAEADLERSLETLERRVKERTEELSEANRALQAQIVERKEADAVRQRLEGELRQSQKLEAIGHLAGGVAHDFNNILMVIQGYSDMLLAETADNEQQRNDLKEIQEAARRGSDLTRQLLAFGRKQVLRIMPLDLNAVLLDTSQMLARLIGENIKLELQPSGEPCPIEADRMQLEQILMNLAVNARDAMTRGGVLSIAVTREDHHGDTPELANGAYVRLTVRDNGCGMDSATRERIFEPFFTTKPTGKGSGLGLSTVYGAVKQLGGHVDVDSVPLQGTTFTVYFPATAGAVAAPREPVVAELAAMGAETVLLVEDDRPVRAVLRSVLRRHGYTVIEADGPREALVLARQHAGRIDLVLSDVIMPEMSGPEMVALFKTVRPEPQVVYLSGYATDALVRDGVLRDGVSLVQKPVSARELLRAVHDTLHPTAAVPIRAAS